MLLIIRSYICIVYPQEQVVELTVKCKWHRRDLLKRTRKIYIRANIWESLMCLLITAVMILCASCSNRVNAEESFNETTQPVITQTEAGQIESTKTSEEETSTETELTETEGRTDSESAILYEYISDPENGQSVGDTAVLLHDGEWHNACVYVVSEALRRVGCDIPVSTCRTEILVEQLKDRGYEISYDLDQLQPGDICFTTDENGDTDGRPTHTYVFLGWAEAGTANVFDNQIYDYGSLYHTREAGLSYFNGQKDRPKEATAFFMHK
jgi:hypothetical protein